MGAWGEEPFANDTALDWIAGPQASLMKHIDEALDDFLESLDDGKKWTDGEYEAIAAAQLLLDCTHVGDNWTANQLDLTIAISCKDDYKGLYKKAINVLEQITVGEWIDEWGSDGPKRIYSEMIVELRKRDTAP